MIQDPNKRMVGRGDKVDGMYILDVNKFNLQSTFSFHLNDDQVFVNKVSARTWHNRLGHLSPQRFDLLKQQLNCDSSICNNDPCYICPLAK